MRVVEGRTVGMQATGPEMSDDWISQGMGNGVEGPQYVQRKGTLVAPSFAYSDGMETLGFRKRLMEPLLQQLLDWLGTPQMRLDVLATSNCHRLLVGYLRLERDLERILEHPNRLGVERSDSHSQLVGIVRWCSGRRSLRFEKLGVGLA